MRWRTGGILAQCILVLACARSQAQGRASLDSLHGLMHAERYPEVIDRGTRLLAELPENDASARAEVAFDVASAYFYSQNENEATRYAQDALRLASAASDTARMLRSTRLLAELLFAVNRYPDAIGMEREGIRLAQAKGDADHLAKFLSGVADNFVMMGVPDSAEHYYRRTQSVLPKDASGQRSLVEGNLAKLLSERGEHAQAIAILEPSVERVKAGDPAKYYKALNTLAYVYHRAGRHREAIGLFEESERLNQEGDKDISTTLENLGFTAESQAALGEHASAYATMLRLEEQLHAYYARTANDEILALEKRFETQRKEQENALLRAENDARRLNEERLRSRWLAAAAFAALLIGLLALLYRNFRVRSQYASDMERLNTELRRVNDLLELRVLRAQLNPHFIHNCQNSAIALVKEGRGDEALGYMQGLSKLMRAVLEQSVTDRIALEDELDFLREYLRLESLRLPDVRWSVQADAELLQEEVLIPALLVQPFVENALWHGLAGKQGDRRVDVRFSAHANGMRCTITDNGVGRSNAVAAPGEARSLATVLTQERLQLLTHRMQQRGTIGISDLHDADGRASGTQVTIDLQL